MTLKVDKAGRIILPKPIRERLDLHTGTDIEVTETPEGLILKPANHKPAMIRVEGAWVHQGEAPEGFDWTRAVERSNDDRVRTLSTW